MADALRALAGFVRSRRRQDIDDDTMLRFALIHVIQVIGEAASKVSAETRARHPSLPWAAIVGMRNRLSHAYFDIDYDILWTTATEAAPNLLAEVERALEAE
jgi:uncharacterized protein with HEPN domain